MLRKKWCFLRASTAITDGSHLNRKQSILTLFLPPMWVHINVHTHINSLTPTHAYVHTFTQTFTHTHERTHSQAYTQTPPPPPHTHPFKHTYIHIYVYNIYSSMCLFIYTFQIFFPPISRLTAIIISTTT